MKAALLKRIADALEFVEKEVQPFNDKADALRAEIAKLDKEYGEVNVVTQKHTQKKVFIKDVLQGLLVGRHENRVTVEGNSALSHRLELHGILRVGSNSVEKTKLCIYLMDDKPYKVEFDEGA